MTSVEKLELRVGILEDRYATTSNPSEHDMIEERILFLKTQIAEIIERARAYERVGIVVEGD